MSNRATKQVVPAQAAAKAIRCAIYTRKSTEEGLQQAFNTLDAQRESAEAYISSQKNEGWLCLPDRYDDGGFSGGKPSPTMTLPSVDTANARSIIVPSANEPSV